MKIVTIGRGTIGGGLAALWRAAGHEVDEIGRDGGDRPARTSYSSLYPGITPALKGVSGLVGKTAIDATNIMSAPEGTFPSYAEEVKSFTGGPVGKSFNWNFGGLFAEISQQRVRPTNLYVSGLAVRRCPGRGWSVGTDRSQV